MHNFLCSIKRKHLEEYLPLFQPAIQTWIRDQMSETATAYNYNQNTRECDSTKLNDPNYWYYYTPSCRYSDEDKEWELHERIDTILSHIADEQYGAL